MTGENIEAQMLTSEAQEHQIVNSARTNHNTENRKLGHYPERLLVRSAGRVVFVRVDDIEWCEACENYIQLHSRDQRHLIRATMTHLESQLDPTRYVRISRSAIVNLDVIKEIRSIPARGRVVCLLDGTQISVGREYRSRLFKVLRDEAQ
ncbi:MAG TPA: LytTR family DNA-binding domain-containing protein [Terriglobales bacterium]|jgi:DNA-binding LytR/AlgR family response regulator